MGHSTWKDKYRYQGTEWSLEQFAVLADGIQVNLGFDELSPEDGTPDGRDSRRQRVIRLIRYYAAEGAMSKPGREGKEVRYEYRHLVEFLVTRMLVKDGWPLSKVAQFVSSNDPDELERMLPEEAMTAAQIELQSIKRSMSRPSFGEALAPMPAPAPAQSSKRSDSIRLSDHRVDYARLPATEPRVDLLADASSNASQKMLDLQGSMAKGRSSVAQLLHSIGFGKHRPEWKEKASIDITPWCTVIFDADQLRQMPHAAFEPLGEALTQALREHRTTSRRERK